MRFAHFTDIHLPIDGRPPLSLLMSKRILGLQSWVRKRRHTHKQWAADALIKDMHAQACDGALVSGDVVNIALPTEFRGAAAWMENAFHGLPTAFVPGNHETYANLDWAAGMAALSRHMQGYETFDAYDAGQPARTPQRQGQLPYVARLGLPHDIAIICCDSAPKTAPGLASGRLGAAQMGRIKALLEEAKARGLYRLIMLHHPITEGTVSPRKALEDAAAFRKMLSVTGADLILHGHTHFPVRETIDGPEGLIPIFGGGSASHAKSHGKYRPAQYALVDIERSAGHWHTQIDVREVDLKTRAVTTAQSLSSVHGEGLKGAA